MYVRSLFVTCLLLLAESWGDEILWSVDYQVFGKFLGSEFRNFSQMKARDLGLRGYIRQNNYNTEGVVEGVWDVIETWKKNLKLGFVTEPPITVTCVDHIFENVIQEYHYGDFHILPNVNMDDSYDIWDRYPRDLLNNSDLSIFSSVQNEIHQNYIKKFKMHRELKDLIRTFYNVKQKSKTFNEQIYNEYLKITNPLIRKLYGQQ